MYFYEICSFIDTHKEDIIKVFIKNASKDLLDSTNFVVSLKDINEQKVIEKLNSGKDYFLVDAGDETHHCGKSPAFIYFHAQGKILFKLVYKPRKAETDRIVIETFSKINNLPSSGKSGNIDLPIYKIINFPTTNLEISLWEYVDGIDIKNSPSAGAFIVNTFNKQPAKLQEAQNTLNRLDAILTSMEISDLHHQNVKIQFINSISILIVPIDLENRQKAPTQLEGDPKAINLTAPELELIRVANLQLNRMPIRYLPVKTNILALLFHDYSSIDTLVNKINEGLTSDQVQVTMPLEELKIYVLISILNSDIPYFTEYLGKVYYGFPRDGLVIGNIKGFL